MPTNTDERPRVYLNKVHLKGYKSIEDVTIDFQKGLNILIGKNGAGKSNLLEFVNHAVRMRRSLKIQFNYAALQFFSDDEQLIEIEYEKKINHINLEIDSIDDRVTLNEKISINHNLVFENANEGEYGKFDFNGREVYYKGSLRAFFIRLGYQPVFPLYLRYSIPDNLESISVASTLRFNDLSFEFWSFPPTLAFIEDILSKMENAFDQDPPQKIADISTNDIFKYLKIQDYILSNLKLYSPIEDVRFNNNINLYREDKILIIDNVKLDFKVNGNWLPWAQLSDGTKRLFYIITEVTYTNGLVLLEEPELGVHPHQFHLLMNFLKEQSAHKQIIISTHAPKALDHLNLDELNNILLVNYDQKMGTQLRHLTDDEQTKAREYANEVGYVSDYWMYSDLEE